MGSVKYTQAQKEAIDTRGKSLLLSAAAGSGKTAVLVQRIIEIISDETNDTNIDNLLVVTFTTLAASQMRERIHRELLKRLKENPGNKKLKKQLMLLSGASIKTIHGFCLDTIKANLNCTDIPVNFRVVDSEESKALMEKAANEMIEEKYSVSDSDFIMLMDTYGYGPTEENFKNIVFGIFFMTNAMANPDGFYDMCLENIKNAGEDFEKSIFCDILVNHCKDVISDNIRKYDICVDICKEHDEVSKSLDLFISESDDFREICALDSLDRMKKLIEGFEFLKKPNGKGEYNEVLKAVRKSAKEDLTKLVKILTSTPEEEQESQTEIYKYIKALIDFVREFTVRFSNEKKKRGVIDFSDFEHITYKILKDENGSPSSVALSYQKKFYEVLIDEYQDTSDIQNAIFDSVSRDKTNLFMVGDVKQSIYKFRQARPENFAKRAAEYKTATDIKKLIPLKHNFRSRKEILDSVNEIFLPIMNMKTGITDYSEEQLVCGGKFQYNENEDYITEILLFDKSQKQCIPEEFDGFGGEGLVIASKIKELVSDEHRLIYDEKADSFRFCSFSDIVILVRSNNTAARNIYDALNEFNIPVKAEFSENFFEQTEIRTIINTLKCINNPRDDISLVSLLKSFSFHFTENELLEIRKSDKNIPFYEAVKKSDSEHAKEFINVLSMLIEFSFSHGCSEIVEEVYEKLNFTQRFSAYKNPKQRSFNLDAFYNISLNYEDNNTGSLKGFLLYLDGIVNTKKSITEVIGTEEKDAVKIMTMHKSKGLEFPVVFVSGLASEFSREDVKGSVLINTDMGIGADYMDSENMTASNTLCRSAVKCITEDEKIGEEMRLLYVALTRAKDKLYITAETANLENSFKKWVAVKETGGFTKNTLLENKQFINWIMPTALNSVYFKVSRFDFSDISLKKTELVSKDKSEIYDDDNAIFEDYKNADKAKLNVKVTVSHANQESESEQKNINVVLDDLDCSEDLWSGSEYGTYFHRMFELTDIKKIKSGENIESIVKELIDKKMINDYPYTKKAIKGIESFYKTDVGKACLEADRVCKEKPFLVRISADKVYNTSYTETVLLQGTSDCYFVKDNEITLIDFKTNKNTDEKKIKEAYSKQMELYCYAIEKAEALKVVKKVIFTSENGNIIEF